MLSVRIFVALVLTCSSFNLARAGAPEVPSGVAPLTEAQILEMFKNKTFKFVAYDEPLTGTTTWDVNSRTVYGDYVMDEEQTGDFEIEWFLKDGMCCIRTSGKEPQCQVIYPYEDGFMEVRPDGVVHAVSRPIN